MAEFSRKTIIDRVLERRMPFLVIFFIVFLLSYAVLFVLDFYPELVWPEKTQEPTKDQINEDSNVIDSVETEESAVVPIPAEKSQPAAVAVKADLPLEIYIEKLDRTLNVSNPTSRSIADLDAALLDGVVRHPDSATFNKEGNIFILGHSSYLPNVFNKNFQAFNEIQDLSWGDTIVVRSEDTEYLYRVDDVYKAKASDVTVPIAGTGPKLTLATCNSFGSKDDRYILEATLVGQESL